MGKPQSNGATVIVGSGMSGVVAALACTLEQRPGPLIVVDPAPSAGGSFSSFRSPEGDYFDRGVHLIPQVLAEPFCDFFTPEFGFDEDFWQPLRYPLRDRSGSFLEGRLNTKTSLIDVNELPAAIGQPMRDEFFACEPLPLAQCQSTGEYLQRNFGPSFKAYIDPLLESLFGATSDELKPSLLTFIPLSRLVVAGLEETQRLTADARYAERIGFPEQANLPDHLIPTNCNYYPRQAGIGQFIEKIGDFIRSRGGEFWQSTRLESVEVTEQGLITRCQVGGVADNQARHVDCENLIWTAPLAHLRGALNNSGLATDWIPSGQPPNRLLEFIHFAAPRPLLQTDAFYVYDLMPGTVFRLSNYQAFTTHQLPHAYTLELIRPVDSNPLSETQAFSILADALSSIGLPVVRPSGLWVDPLRLPLPNFSIDGITNQAVRQLVPPFANLHLFGSAASNGFQLSRNLYVSAASLLEALNTA